MTRKTLLIAGFIVLSTGAIQNTHAADLTQFSAPASGADMSTGAMGRFGMYTPHPNDCNVSTEVFIGAATAPDGVSLGYCIDKTENAAGALGWSDARNTCLSAKKRLPEPGEFNFSCANPPSGLVNMDDNWEWATNFSTNVSIDAGTRDGVAATAMGNGSCTKATTGYIASNDDNPSILPFRCVH